MESIKGRKVMIVEDDKFFISLISKKLSDNGLPVIAANDGKSALELVVKENPDIIILDIMLPDMDGFEILKQIKQLPERINIPVVFLSNLGSREDIMKGKELGATNFLIKATVTMDEVLQEIVRILGAK
ncbi:MAG: response regulator [bacterium]